MQGPETRTTLIGKLNEPASEEVWREFVTIYQPLVIRVSMAKGLQHADAEDLAQEVFSIVKRSITSFRSRGSGSFRAWLFRITRNLVVNQLTRCKGPVGSGDSHVQQWLSQQPERDNETASLFDLELHRQQLQRAADEVRPLVEPDTWDAFWMTAVEGKSISDVARSLGKSEGAVRMAKCRVTARLQTAALNLSGQWETDE
ncbi:RNA polymerase sigma-70 factor (ECF subfamily) [Rhodopirellula rubra]|uniref:RNA polymerase sigma-70 factor (ECF subfamily) n=1 Tax=Aporhodopirellula rubra TaxID=980271 RepID=A0A7W5E0E9_9BACT|nr:sigma-70 family RNA polymerase sigma factor [Aporhodopirellula rubra]MBB3207388.1 RNA polymerase sigma-70 factor (ECF subfamily) [Aporhodopirellula rubra]